VVKSKQNERGDYNMEKKELRKPVETQEEFVTLYKEVNS